MKTKTPYHETYKTNKLIEYLKEIEKLKKENKTIKILLIATTIIIIFTNLIY
tara:strand:- start:18365 stop:18520 length:156 start_codon:yes stop_codon:yes gene_type:complete